MAEVIKLLTKVNIELLLQVISLSLFCTLQKDEK